jgi:hypothetical protein
MSESSARPLPNMLMKAARADRTVVSSYREARQNVKSINQQYANRVNSRLHPAMKLCCG